MERQNYLIEELIKADPTYRPPADYRPAKKHRKVLCHLYPPFAECILPHLSLMITHYASLSHACRAARL